MKRKGVLRATAAARRGFVATATATRRGCVAVPTRIHAVGGGAVLGTGGVPAGPVRGA